MKRLKKITLTVASLAAAIGLSAQQRLTFDEAMGAPVVPTEQGKSLHWAAGEGDRYTTWEADGLVARGVKENRAQLLIPDSLLRLPGGGNLHVRSYSLSADGSRVLIYTNSVRVWRYDTRGDYWLLDKSEGTLRQLGASLPAQSLMFAKFSPDGSRVAYVSRNNIYVEECRGGGITQLTTDGNDDIINGTFDWVYEEEFSLRDGFRWSPDGETIAYWQSDASGTGWFQIINNVDSLYPFVQRFPYPKAGTPNSAVRVGTVPVRGGATTWIDIPGDARNNYLVYLDFVPQSNQLLIQQMNREQNSCKVYIAGADGSAVQNILTETDSAWVELYSDVQWLDGNRYFTWMSERSGWRHLYRVSRDGKQVQPITAGDFDVVQVLHLNPKSGRVYFIASPQNPTERYLYSARLGGKGKVERVTPADALQGQHSYSISAAGGYAVHTYSNANTPPVRELVTLPAHKRVELYTDNTAAAARFAERGFRPKEFVRAQSDGWLLDCFMIKPSDFDPTKKYPVILDIYGEPAGSTVQNVWQGADIWHRYLADRGYIVVSVDPRGADTPRGRHWRKCIYGEVGVLASRDFANAVADLGRQFPYIDLARVGITGWSGGGSQTLNCMFRYPQVFATGIAVAFVADQRLYDTIYQERYMNTPQNNPEGYLKGSPIHYAAGLQGNLLLIHGTGDDNVHYQCCERLVNELVKHEKVFSQISYPMRTHSIHEGEGTTRHLRRSMVDYWLKNLPAGGR